jgi:hypothetical protein
LAALKSFGIRVVTGSDWSHAAIVGPTGHLIEAVGDGVLRLAIAGTLIDEDQNVEVLRLKPEFGGPTVAAAAAVFAETKVSHRYASFLALVNSVVKFNWCSPKDHQHFCSHLVAQSYENAGVSLLPPLSSAKVTPQRLKESQCLAIVTHKVLDAVSAATASLPLPMFGDRDEAVPSEDLRERAVVALALGKPSDLQFSSAPTSLPELADVIATQFQTDPGAARTSDRALLLALESVGWRETHASIVNDVSVGELCQYLRANAKTSLTDQEQRTAVVSFLKQQEHSKTQQNERRRENQIWCQQQYVKTGLPSFKYLADDYLNLWTDGEEMLADLRTTLQIL